MLQLYSTELLCLNLKTNLSNTVVCNAVWQCDCVKPMRIGLIKTLRKKEKKKKQDKAVWCTETPSRRTQGKPASHGERRVTLDTMLKIEDAAGVSLPIGTVSLKPGK